MHPSVTVDIDVGGTFADGFFSHGGRSAGVKVETTPHDLAACFWSCLEVGAKQLDYPTARAMLADTSVIRFATTVGTNAILEGRGPRLGLIVSAGAERCLYGPIGNGLIDRFVPRDLIVGVSENEDGAPDETAVRDGLRQLLANGARHIVVSLKNAGRRPAAERTVASIVRRYFPRHYLGSVPLLLSSDVRPRIDDFTRTNVAVINAYLHRDLSGSLYRADDRLRMEGYGRPLLVTHSSGGAARVAKTRAIDTYNSGPVAGLFGCAQFARDYQLEHVITVDVGGTSTDIGVIVNGTLQSGFDSMIAGVPLDLPIIEINSIAGGGGSIARPSATGGLTIGPDSAGALPGPAAYALGGVEPTVTDAYLILGYLDPGFFLGGRRRLDRVAAEKALLERLAKPLNVAVEEAALMIVDELVRLIADAIRTCVPREYANGASIFAFGGGGGLLAARLGQALDADTYVFAQGAVLNAYGSSQMDIVHTYERTLDAEPGREAVEAVVKMADDLEAAARRDMRGEGFLEDPIEFTLDLEIRGGEQHAPRLISTPHKSSWRATAEDAIGKTSEGDQIITVLIRASVEIPHAESGAVAEATMLISACRRGARTVVLPEGSFEVPLYDRQRLRAGHIVPGPALIEGADTTILLPTDRQLEIDRYGNGLIRRVQAIA